MNNDRGREKQAASRDGHIPLAQRVQRGERVRKRVERQTNAARPVGMSFWNMGSNVPKAEQNRIRKQVLAEMAVELCVPDGELKLELRLAEAVSWVRKVCGRKEANAILSGNSGLTEEQVVEQDGLASETILEKIRPASHAAE